VAEPAVDGQRAERDARGLVLEIYQTIGRGKTDSLFSLLSAPLVVFGPRRIDAAVTRSDALVALGKVLDSRGTSPAGSAAEGRRGSIDRKAKTHAQLRSGGLSVVASRGGHSAWAFDVVSVAGQALAVTAVLANTDDIWAVAAAAVAALPSSRQAKAESARDAIVPPGGAAAGKADVRAAAAVERFRLGLAAPQQWGDDLASAGDAIAIGPVAGQIARGKPAIEKLWKARMKSNVREATNGDVTSAITADGQLVWLSVPVTRVADDEDPTPLRIFAIYARDGVGWKLTALHEAMAIDEPGAGAPFKKILPPPPPPEPKAAPEPAKPDATVAKPTKPATKKKPRTP
jgi:ketosteroid isomerase-like protein